MNNQPAKQESELKRLGTNQQYLSMLMEKLNLGHIGGSWEDRFIAAVGKTRGLI